MAKISYVALAAIAVLLLGAIIYFVSFGSKLVTSISTTTLIPSISTIQSISSVVTTSINGGTPRSGPVPPGGQNSSFQQTNAQMSIEVTLTNATYAQAPEASGSGFISTGQNASILLSGIDFNNTGGPLLFNHLAGIATDGQHLAVADRNNNRILIWDSIPTSSNTPPDIVLGQKNFYSNNPSHGMDGLNWPSQISIGGGKLVVADTDNNRILIWNSMPTVNDQPADLEIVGQSSFLSPSLINWPWGVWTNGTKLAVTSTFGGSVLIWDTFPTHNNESASFYINASGEMGTPRQITSDGKHLMIGDHNPRVPNNTGTGSFVWDTFPTSNVHYDYFLGAGAYTYVPPGAQPVRGGDWFRGTIMPDGKTILLGDTLYILGKFPLNSSAKPDVIQRFSNNSLNRLLSYAGGDGSDLVVANGKLIIAFYNQNKIVIFDTIPTTSNMTPSLTIGANGFFDNRLNDNFFITNPVPATDGKSIFVTSDFDSKMYVYRNIPAQSGAHPDVVYSNIPAWQQDFIYGNTLMVASSSVVDIWNKLPLNGKLPDLQFSGKIGDVNFMDIRGIAMDSKYFYLADSQAGKIYVWNGIPSNTTNPLFMLSNITAPTRLSSDGNFLVVTLPNGGPLAVGIYNVSRLSANSKPVYINMSMNLPEDAIVSHGHLFIADTGDNRVLAWNKITDAIKGSQPDAILGCTASRSLCSGEPEIGKNTLFWPAGLSFDGTYLWVGEYKFSGRLLQFHVTS